MWDTNHIYVTYQLWETLFFALTLKLFGIARVGQQGIYMYTFISGSKLVNIRIDEGDDPLGYCFHR